MKSKYQHHKTLPKEQIKSNGSTWPQFEHMTNIIKGSTKREGALKKV